MRSGRGAGGSVAPTLLVSKSAAVRLLLPARLSVTLTILPAPAAPAIIQLRGEPECEDARRAAGARLALLDEMTPASVSDFERVAGMPVDDALGGARIASWRADGPGGASAARFVRAQRARFPFGAGRERACAPAAESAAPLAARGRDGVGLRRRRDRRGDHRRDRHPVGRARLRERVPLGAGGRGAARADPAHALVVRDGVPQRVDVVDLVPGDVVQLVGRRHRPRRRPPARDGRARVRRSGAHRRIDAGREDVEAGRRAVARAR